MFETNGIADAKGKKSYSNRTWWIATGVIACLLTVALVQRRAAEKERAYLDKLARIVWGPEALSGNLPKDELLRLGPRFPLLLKELESKPPAFEEELSWLQTRLRFAIYPRRGSAYRKKLAADAISAFGTNSIVVLPDLLRILKDSDPIQRQFAAYTLGHLGNEARPAVPALIVSTKDTNAGVRHGSLISLGAIRADPKDCIPVILTGLEDEWWSVRAASLRALASFGKDAAPAVPQIERRLNDKIPFVSEAARKALEEIAQDLEDYKKSGSP